MSPMASLVTTNRMQQCFKVLFDIYKAFLLLFHCCILLEIKPPITATATITTTYDRGCWHMYIDTSPGSGSSKASSSSCLLDEEQTLPYLTGLNWFAILHRFVQFRSLLRQMQPGNFHDLFYACKTAVARQYLVLWHRASTGLLAAHQHLSPTVGPWDLEQLELLTEKCLQTTAL